MLSLFCNTTYAIGLTEFSKQLVNLYDKAGHIREKDEVVFCAKKDSLCYRLILHSQDIDVIPLNANEYLGRTKYNGHTVYLFGEQDSLFHTGKRVIPSKCTAKGQRDDIVIFDPIMWDIWLKNNLKVIEPLTNGMDSTTYYQIEQISNTYLPDWTDRYPDKTFNWRDYTTPTEYMYIQMDKQLANGQIPVEDPNDSTIFRVTEIMPTFPGGQQALFKYIKEHFTCPDLISESKGKIVCEFIVEPDGSLSNIEVIRSSGNQSLDKEAIRVIKQMPNWKPGEYESKLVRVKYAMPITYNCVGN